MRILRKNTFRSLPRTYQVPDILLLLRVIHPYGHLSHQCLRAFSVNRLQT